MRRRLLQVTVAFALASGACRDHSDDAYGVPPDGAYGVLADGGAELLQLADLDQALIQANCEYFLRCGFYVDRGVCESALTFNLAAALDPHIRAGKVRYDAAAAFTCVQGIRAGGCYFYDPAPPSPTICRQVFQGMTDDDQACTVDSQCRSGVCDLGCGPDECCEGTCLAFSVPKLVPEGGACTSSSENLACADGTVCNLTPDAAYRFSCVRRAGLGETCDNVPCDRLLFCLPNATGPATCVHYPYRGEACSDAMALCASRTDYCDKTIYKCVPLASVGTPCESDSTCARANYCDVEATHTCQPRRGPGGTCRSNHDCLAYLDCTNGVCTRLPLRPICP